MLFITVIHFLGRGVRGVAFSCQTFALHFIIIATHTTVYIELWIPFKKRYVEMYLCMRFHTVPHHQVIFVSLKK